MYTVEYTAYITGENGNEHIINIDVEFNVELVGGIGYYEFWGHEEYDAGKPGIVDARVLNAYVERNGKFRSIRASSWPAQYALEDFEENYDLRDLVD